MPGVSECALAMFFCLGEVGQPGGIAQGFWSDREDRERNQRLPKTIILGQWCYLDSVPRSPEDGTNGSLLKNSGRLPIARHVLLSVVGEVSKTNRFHTTA